MISRSHRFHGHAAVPALYRRGLAARSQLMSIRYQRKADAGAYRAAVVVSKKVHKSAVVRNRIRRRMYEIIRQQADRLEPADIVITVHSERIANLPAVELASQLEGLLKKASLLRSVSHDIVKPQGNL